MSAITQLSVPVPFLGTVNLWLLRGEPLTLVDTGIAGRDGLLAVEAELARAGVELEELELVILTHHHLDHSGLAGVIRERSGARVAALAETAAWGADYARRAAGERRFSRALMARHGTPAELVDASEPFWEHIARNGAGFATDTVLADGDVIQAGGRTWQVVHRPGHSTTDTLFVDEQARLAIVGDHLLAEITSGAEVMPTDPFSDERRRALPEYLSSLPRTAALALDRCLPGHGPEIADPRGLVAERLAFHAERRDRIEQLVGAGHATAFEIGSALWDDETARTQTVLVIWEVVGHLELLLDTGAVVETVGEDGRSRFTPAPGDPDVRPTPRTRTDRSLT